MSISQDVRIWRDKDIPGLEVALFSGSQHSYPRHSHEYYSLGLMQAGGRWCFAPGHEESFVAPGEIALINPGQVHTGIPLAGCPEGAYHMLYVEADWMAQAAAELKDGHDAAPEFERWVVRSPGAFGLLVRSAKLVGGAGARLAKESAMLAGFSRLIAAHASPRGRIPSANGEPGAVRRAREYLDNRLECGVSLEELAQAAGLSRYHLLRVFQRATGLSPHAYHTQRRIERGRALLRAGVPIVEAAAATGFADQSHFTTTFRRYVGMTPGRYLAR